LPCARSHGEKLQSSIPLAALAFTRATAMAAFTKLKGNVPEFVPKPKWMRWKTYHRWKAQLDWAEAKCDQHLAGLIARIGTL
jgi:hypothetical protein